MLPLSRLLLAKSRRGKHLPNPASSLLNPRSQRTRLRQAMAAGTAAQQRFDEQAMFANIDGSGSEGGEAVQRGGRHSVAARLAPKSAKQRKTQHVQRTGQRVAEEAKHMTDSEWESVSMDDKHAFTRYMSKLLRESPTKASEQQRRRYFETTMADVRDLDPQRTVRDEYERLKLGLPVHLKHPQRTLGVSQAIYEASDATLFDPDNAHKLENAMTAVKQVFADYIQHRREGTSTEAERRKLANMTAELNVETQRHLANMFKYAEHKLRQLAADNAKTQLEELQHIKRMMAARPAARRGASSSSSSSRSKRNRREVLKRSISRSLGMDVDVVTSLLSELETQERFMCFCEVFARLTVGSGFEHRDGDEGVDAYTDSLRRLYAVDARQLSTLDAVQYFAAKEATPPVEWARRWYERILLIPLQTTPEYKRLKNMHAEDMAALSMKAKLREEEASTGVPPTTTTTSEGEAPANTSSSSSSSSSTADGTTMALTMSGSANKVRQDGVVNLVEKMFLRPDDPRLESLHEKRLRYIAYLQMERQIKQARENVRRFAGVEHLPEAAECRALYAKLQQRRAELTSITVSEDGANTTTDTSSHSSSLTDDAETNIFDDAEAASLFEQIRAITERVMAEQRVRSSAEARAKKVEAALSTIRTSKLGAAAAQGDQIDAMQDELEEKKQRVARRLLGILEKDVQSELHWIESMEEADRPPLLPVPEGMSYVSAADVRAWREVRDADERKAANPFTRNKLQFQPTLFGQKWGIPDKPVLFWGTGAMAVQQALQHAAEDAERRRRGEELAPPYPCPENPWGWRLVKDVLDE